MDAFRDWLAPTGNGRTIITTRGTRWTANGLVVPLDTLGDDDARVLLTTRRPPCDSTERAAAEALITALGGHPLALDVAGASIVERGFARTLEDATDQSQGVLDLAAELGEELPNGHEKSIAVTLLHSIRRLDDNGLRLLQLASLLAAAPIPLELVLEVWGHSNNAVRAIAAVKRESLIEQDYTCLFIQKLVSRVIHHHAPPSDALRAAAVAALNRVMPAARDIREHGRLADWLPHARAVTDTAEDEATLTLLNWLWWHEYVRGNYPAAADLGRRQWKGCRHRLGEEHPDTLAAMSNVAQTLRALGDFAGARALDEQALSVRRQGLRAEHPDTLTSMNNLAGTLRAQGDLAAARTLQEQVLAACQRMLGAEHPHTLTAMNNLASTLWAQGDHAGARALHEQVLAASQRVLGAEHPDTLTAMNNLAETLRAQGDHAGARALQEQELANCRRVLGAEHPDTLGSMNNLASTLRAQGNLAAARALHEQVLAASQRVLGPEHPATLTSMNNLASTLLDQGDLAEARALQEQVLTARQRVLGAEHPDTLTAMSNLAEMLRNQGDYAAARALYELPGGSRQSDGATGRNTAHGRPVKEWGNTRIPGQISATDSFDVFLSHSSAQKDWVEALARNLEDAGKRVFLDKWHLVPGESYVDGLRQGMTRSRAVVVVVSPDAYHSGWVSREIETAVARSLTDRSFTVIPVVVGAVEAAMPFTEALYWVDFRAPVPYREAFARLLAGLDRQPPGPAPYYDGPVAEPAEAAYAPMPRAANPVQRVLNRLDGSQIVVLLTRQGQSPNQVIQALTEAASQRFPDDRIRAIAPPWSAPGESLAAYYRELARQAGLGDGIDSAAAFVTAWRQQMSSGRWLWIVSGFEHGPAEERTTLFREIRRRTEGNLDAAFILCGGEKLHHLIYSDGDHPVLSGVPVIHWPEMTVDDLRTLRLGLTPSDDGLLSRLLDVSGGHPALVRDIVDAGRDSGDWSSTAMEQAVINSPVVWSALVPLFASPANVDRLRDLVDRDEVGDSLPYLFDPLLRRLFWSNLVRETVIDRRPRLTWRSPAIRTTAQIAVTDAETVR